MLSDQLLKILCCPLCKSELQYEQHQSRLVCRNCGNVYSVEQDIPVMIVKKSDE